MIIKTNNQPRALKCLFDFTIKEQELIRGEFDWLEDIEADWSFFEYRGSIFNLSTFLRVSANKEPGDDFYDWDAVYGDSYYSGTVVKICSDPDYVIVGRWFS